MAYPIGPGFSNELHGSLGKEVTFSKRSAGVSGKTGMIVRKYHKPNKKPTIGQYEQRQIIGMITARWKSMTTLEKQPFVDEAHALEIAGTEYISGFNLFVRYANTDLFTYLGLCLYYTFNEQPKATCDDMSGRGFNGTLYPTYPTDCPVPVDSINERLGKAMHFDGVNDYIRFASPHDWGNNLEGSYGFRLRMLGPPPLNRRIMNPGATRLDVNLEPAGVGRPNGRVFIWFTNSLNVGANIYSDAYGKYCDGEWHSWFVCKGPTDIKIYVDAVLVKTYNTILKCYTNPVYGYLNNTSAFCDLDEVVVYNRGLSQQEVTDLSFLGTVPKS